MIDLELDAQSANLCLVQFFPQHFMLLGLLFYIPEPDDRQIGNSRFSDLSGSTTLVVIVIIVVIVAPLRS